MKTTHITTFSAAIAERQRSTEDEINRCKDQLDDARDTLGHTEETIRAYELELERLRQFRTLGLEHIQQLEFNLNRLVQYREGCTGLLIEAGPAASPAARWDVNTVSRPTGQAAGHGTFSKHLDNNGAT